MLLIIIEGDIEEGYVARTKVEDNLVIGEHASSIKEALVNISEPLSSFENIQLWESDITVMLQKPGDSISEAAIHQIFVEDIQEYEHMEECLPDMQSSCWLNDRHLTAGYGTGRKDAILDLSDEAFSSNFTIRHIFKQ